MPLDLKQNITATFCNYYADNDREVGGVRMLSSENDMVLAECSILGGMKVLR